MGTIDISFLCLLLGLLLLILPLYFFHLYGVKLVKATIIAALRMVVQLFLTGLYLKYMFTWNNPFINIFWMIIMAIVAAYTATHRIHLRQNIIILPLCVGLFSSAVIVGFYFLILVLQLDHPFNSRYFIPIMGILMGNMLGVNILGLGTFFDGVKKDIQQYHFLLGNGATLSEAIKPFKRIAIERSFAPCVANMAVMGIVSLPGTMTGQILGGSIPDVAIKYQMMIVVITATSSMLSLIITLWLAERRSFDKYGRLRNIYTSN